MKTFGSFLLLVTIGGMLYSATIQVSGEEVKGNRTCVEKPEGFVYCGDNKCPIDNKGPCLEGGQVKCFPGEDYHRKKIDVCFCDEKHQNPNFKRKSDAVCNAFTPEELEKLKTGGKDEFMKQLGNS